MMSLITAFLSWCMYASYLSTSYHAFAWFLHKRPEFSTPDSSFSLQIGEAFLVPHAAPLDLSDGYGENYLLIYK